MDYSDLDELVGDTETPLYQDFERAAKFLTTHHDALMPDDLLGLYALYKQGTVGDCDTPKPGIFNIQSRAKWNAWNDIKGTSVEQARIGYIDKITAHFPDWKQSTKEASWAAVSRVQDVREADNSTTLADFIKDEDLEKVIKYLSSLKEDEVNELDESGLGLIHWCTDRGNANILKVLINVPGIDVSLRDVDGQTALHYASSCGHNDCLKILLEAGADRSSVDNDGNTYLDVAYDDSTRQLIQSLRNLNKC